MTSTTMYTPIKPTYLYIKQHSVTGLKYFGKTTQDPYKYLGSGTRWRNHIKKHGRKFVETIWLSDLYYDTSITEHALHFSYENNIVKSNEWANLKPEDGLEGCVSGFPKSDETKAKMSISATGKVRSVETRARISAVRTGSTASDKTKAKMSASCKGRTPSEETKAKISASHLGKECSVIECPHCGKSGGDNNMKRWHFDNCKLNLNFIENKIYCPHCMAFGTAQANMTRYHFNNCKQKLPT